MPLQGHLANDGEKPSECQSTFPLSNCCAVPWVHCHSSHATFPSQRHQAGSAEAAGDGSPGHQACTSPLWAAKPPACPTVAVLSWLYGCEETTVGVEASQ